MQQYGKILSSDFKLNISAINFNVIAISLWHRWFFVKLQKIWEIKQQRNSKESEKKKICFDPHRSTKCCNRKEEEEKNKIV